MSAPLYCDKCGERILRGKGSYREWWEPGREMRARHYECEPRTAINVLVKKNAKEERTTQEEAQLHFQRDQVRQGGQALPDLLHADDTADG